MRRSIALTVLAAATALSAACGGGSSGQATLQTAAAAGAAAGTAAPQAVGADPQAAAGSLPQVTTSESGGGNDGPEAKLPQGMSADKATTAGMGSDGAPVISVMGTDTSCIPDMTTVPAGKVWFKLTNKGNKITELYLESPKAKELVEVEKVTTGNSGAFATKVKAGSYLIACEPGMNDVQIRTPLTVTPGS
jgi:Cupredoxin-like domain